jgi:hypothetical protein
MRLREFVSATGGGPSSASVGTMPATMAARFTIVVGQDRPEIVTIA